jgi:hypothetical protein
LADALVNVNFAPAVTTSYNEFRLKKASFSVDLGEIALPLGASTGLDANNPI